MRWTGLCGLVDHYQVVHLEEVAAVVNNNPAAAAAADIVLIATGRAAVNIAAAAAVITGTVMIEADIAAGIAAAADIGVDDAAVETGTVMIEADIAAGIAVAVVASHTDLENQVARHRYYCCCDRRFHRSLEASRDESQLGWKTTHLSHWIQTQVQKAATRLRQAADAEEWLCRTVKWIEHDPRFVQGTASGRSMKMNFSIAYSGLAVFSRSFHGVHLQDHVDADHSPHDGYYMMGVAALVALVADTGAHLVDRRNAATSLNVDMAAAFASAAFVAVVLAVSQETFGVSSPILGHDESSELQESPGHLHPSCALSCHSLPVAL